MKFLSFILSVICATTLPVSARDDALLADFAENPIELDELEINANRESDFTLPLNSKPDSGSRLGLSNRDLPVSVSVVTQEAMQLRGFRTAVEAVEGAVGMTGGTSYGSIPTYATRGFTGNSVTIMRDGIRQNTASQSSRSVDSFNLDRVEILKGPASLMFGEGSVGGAVNYISKSPNRTAQSEALISYGSWGNFRAGVGTGGPVVADKVFYRVDLSHSQNEGYVDGNNQRYTGLTGALGWDVSPDFKLTYTTTWLEDWNESDYGNPVVYDAVDRYDPGTGTITRVVDKANRATDSLVNARVDPSARRTNYNIADNYAETENTFNRLQAKWNPSSDWTITNESYVASQLLKWRNVETYLWNPVTQLVDRQSLYYIYRDDLLLGNRLDAIFTGDIAGQPNRLIVGTLIERNHMIRGGIPDGAPTAITSVSLLDPIVGTSPGGLNRFQKDANIIVRTTAFYLENAFDLTDRLKLITGLRYDLIDLQRDSLITPDNPNFSTYRKEYHPWTGRAGAVWNLTKEVNLYASYSRAAEPVTQFSSFSSSRDSFSLQTGRQYEAGAKGSLFDDQVDFTVSFYDIEKNDILTSTLDPVSGLRVSQQIGSQVSQGTEIAAAYSPDHEWRFEGNLAWTWLAEFQDYNENFGSSVINRSGNRPSNVPEVIASSYVSRQIGRHWRIGSGLRYVSKQAANNANLIWLPSYTTLEASLTYQRERWSVTLRGRNLLDETYEETATGSGLMQRLADPRSFEVSVKLKL